MPLFFVSLTVKAFILLKILETHSSKANLLDSSLDKSFDKSVFLFISPTKAKNTLERNVFI